MSLALTNWTSVHMCVYLPVCLSDQSVCSLVEYYVYAGYALHCLDHYELKCLQLYFSLILCLQYLVFFSSQQAMSVCSLIEYYVYVWYALLQSDHY